MIKKQLLSDIEVYCKLNELDSEVFINKLLSDGFMKIKYGDKPGFIKEEVREPIKEEVIEEPKEEVREPIKEEVIKPIKKERDLYGE